jgi:hypothetical protein
MLKFYCNAKCENIHCNKKLTELKKLGSFTNNSSDQSKDCNKYIKSVDTQIDDLIKRKIED